MYLKKIDGPRSISLPDGSVMTRADLPSMRTRRWVASRKAAVVMAVLHGLITREAALDMYALYEDEFTEWDDAVRLHGRDALKATARQRYRQLKGD